MLYNYLAGFDDAYFYLYVLGLIVFTLYCHKKIRVEQKHDTFSKIFLVIKYD